MTPQQDTASTPRAQVPIRVAIIDDHQVFADALAGRIASEPDMTVVGTAQSVDQGLVLLSLQEVDVVVLDLDLHGLDGLALGRQILELHPGIGIVIVTGAADEAARVLEAVQMGVRGWVAKHASLETLLSALRAAARGESHIPADMLTRALMFLSTGGAPVSPDAEAVGRLTRRERDVLYGLMEGLTRNEIGQRLQVSPNTVRTHVQSILSKLNVHSALGAVALARRAGVTDAAQVS